MWEDVVKPVNVSVSMAMLSLVEWEGVRNRKWQGSQPQRPRGVKVWRKLDRDELKFNVDAVIFAEERCFGIGMCIHNDHGEFVKAQTHYISEVFLVHVRQRHVGF